MTKELEAQKIDPAYWRPCPGCPEGHPTFWKTVVESPQWKAWEKEQAKRFHWFVQAKKEKSGKPIFDIDEVRECNVISPHHFQEFLKFCRKLPALKAVGASGETGAKSAGDWKWAQIGNDDAGK